MTAALWDTGMVSIAFDQVTPGQLARTADASDPVPVIAVRFGVVVVLISLSTWRQAVRLQSCRLWFHIWSDCYWEIALFGGFKALIGILKGSFPVARFLFLPMSYSWFPHTEDSLKLVEAQRNGTYIALWGEWWRSRKAACGFYSACGTIT